MEAKPSGRSFSFLLEQAIVNEIVEALSERKARNSFKALTAIITQYQQQRQQPANRSLQADPALALNGVREQ